MTGSVRFFYFQSTLLFQAIADMVTEENLAEGRLYPPLNTIREVSFKIAVKVSDLSVRSALIPHSAMEYVTSIICLKYYGGILWHDSLHMEQKTDLTQLYYVSQSVLVCVYIQ